MMISNKRFTSHLQALLFGMVLILFGGMVMLSCSYRETVDKTTKTVNKTTKKLTRTIRFSDDDLQRIAAVIGFENKSLYRSKDFTQLFRKGIPEYLNKECDDVTVADPDAGHSVEGFHRQPGRYWYTG